MVDWSSKKDFFEWDGSWRDLYIFDTDRTDWQQLLSAVRTKQLLAEFCVDSAPYPLPDVIEAVQAIREQASPYLHIWSGNLNINCHFFAIEQMEFDLDPREVVDDVAFEQVLAFMRFIGMLVGKVVHLTPEDAPTYCQLCYNPITDRIAPCS